MLLIQKELNDLSSTLPAVLNFQIQNGPMFLQDVLSTLMLCSLDITQHPKMTNKLKKLETSKFASEQLIQQTLSLLPESGVLHGIGHYGLYVQPSHTELASLRNMLSTSLAIIGLFAATNVDFHNHVILFDKAVHRRVGARQDLELTDFNKFFDLRSTHMDSIGAAVIQCASAATLNKPSGTSHKKLPEPCHCWNEGLCMLESTQCFQLHVCSKCLLSGHKNNDCSSKQ